MRLVRGRPWDDLLAEGAELPPREFLDRHLPVLIDMAQAVAFAHSRGIVHRDLKPSQVMVGDYGEVLLMDWGLAVIFDIERANATEDKPIDARLGMTLESASNPCGTVAFLAPEQTESTAANIGPWTDVYLLGGTLYYLLTLSYPHGAPDIPGAFRQAMLGEVVPPQQRAPVRDVPMELADLCARALEPDREGRLQSAAAFLQALRDFQSGATKRRESEAIVHSAGKRLDVGIDTYREFAECENELSRAIGLWGENRAAQELQERALAEHAQLALRNSDLVLARALAERLENEGVCSALLASIERQERRARHHRTQRRVLIRATAVLCAILAFLAVFAYRRAVVAQDAQRKAELSAQMAENALGQARKKAIEAEQERDLARDARRRAEGLMSFMLVDLREELEPLNRLDILDQVAVASLDYFENLPSESFTPTAWHQRALSLRQIAQVLMGQGKLAEADEALRQARDLMDQLIRNEPEETQHRREAAIILGEVAGVRDSQGQLGEALALTQESRAILERLFAHDRSDQETARALAGRCSQEMQYQLDAGDLEEARRLQEKALDIQRQIVLESPGSSVDRLNLAGYQTLLGSIQERQGLLPEAMASQEEALSSYEKLAAEKPGDPSRLSALAGGYSDYARLLRQSGRMDEALTLAKQSVDIFKPLAEADTANLDWQYRLSRFVLSLAVLQEIAGEMTLAREEYERTIAILERLVTQDPGNMEWRFNLGRAHQFLADFLLPQRLLDEALIHASKAQIIYRALYEAAPENAEYQRHLGASLNAKGLILGGLGKSAVAEAALQDSLAIRREMALADPTNAVRHRDIAVGLTNLASVLKTEERYDDAIEAYRESAGVLRSLSERSPQDYQLRSDLIATQTNIGTVLEELGRHEEALKAYDLAAEGLRSLVEFDPANMETQRMLTMIHLTRGGLREAMEKPKDALADFEEAARQAAGQLAHDEQNLDARESLAVALSQSADVLWSGEERQKSLEMRQKALAEYKRRVEANPSDPYWVFGLLRTRVFLGFDCRELEHLEQSAET